MEGRSSNRLFLGVEVLGLGFADLANLLLKAGHPPQPSAPPAPLQLPPPGQEPGGCSGSRRGTAVVCAELDVVDTAAGDVLWRCRRPSSGAPGLARLKFEGRGAFLVLRYKPQALHIVLPAGDRRHRGVLFVPQLLQIC